MTVQELIDELSKVKDKTKEVNFLCPRRVQEIRRPVSVNYMLEIIDCVILY